MGRRRKGTLISQVRRTTCPSPPSCAPNRTFLPTCCMLIRTAVSNPRNQGIKRDVYHIRGGKPRPTAMFGEAVFDSDVSQGLKAASLNAYRENSRWRSRMTPTKFSNPTE
jgi:hypothetical protein